MSLAKQMFRSMTLAGALALGSAPVVALAGTVVASSGPSAKQYPVGKKMKDTDRITLKAGDMVTILDTKGTRVLKGAGTYTVGVRGATKRSAFSALTRQRSSSRVRTGAVRAGVPVATGAPRNPNIWYVDVSEGGKMCLSDLSSVILWRPDNSGSASYHVANTGSEAHLSVEFSEGEAMRTLDTNRLPITEDATYRITGPGGAPTEIQFISLAESGADAEELAATLIAKGCDNQLSLLAETLMTR